ncbi:hypothetical protein DFA_07022 [Cavenderia fasciculata]|uniref:Uncharacterized protein n=1 Tax=Cavenderia fasciculata TaxID=261658 RepID=F4PXB2_CACFS|nr:uncharacterized protein DFA_07022 [Cavenderia fasciculata]EGG19915.1 hypothetical protein DFA_07022 [Cavenderia fasciculata]|eukprot:XP_004366898.1 hypothetical protein DFA_07022 [Cavenderia fasciculata]
MVRPYFSSYRRKKGYVPSSLALPPPPLPLPPSPPPSPPPPPSPSPSSRRRVALSSQDKHLNKLLHSSRGRSSKASFTKKKTGDNELDLPFLVATTQNQKELCLILGVRLRFEPKTNFKSSADRRADSVSYEKTNTHLVCLEVNTAAKWRPSDISRLIQEFHEPDHPTEQLESLFYRNGMQFQLDRIFMSTKSIKDRKSDKRVLLGEHEVSYNFFVLLFYFQRGRSCDPEDYTCGDGNWTKLKFYYVIYCQRCLKSSPPTIPMYYEDWLNVNQKLEDKVLQEEATRIRFVNYARVLLEEIRVGRITLKQAIRLVIKNIESMSFYQDNE